MGNTMILWIVLGLIVLFALIAIVALKKKRKKSGIPDYRALFSVGIVFFIIGLGQNNHFMWIIGLAMFGIGLVNRDKWHTTKRTKAEKKMAKLLIIIAVIALVIGIAVFLLVRKGML